MTQSTGKDTGRQDQPAPRRQEVGAQGRATARGESTQDRQAGAGDAHVQGEGDYEAARRYRKDVQDFVQSQDVEHAAHEAEPRSREESEQLQRAEEEGRSHARN